MYETQPQYQLVNDPEPTEPRRRSKWGWILLGLAMGLIVGVTSGGER